MSSEKQIEFTKENIDTYLKEVAKEYRNQIGKEMAQRIGKSERTVQRIISSLMEKGVIKRIGSNKTGCWKVMETD